MDFLRPCRTGDILHPDTQKAIHDIIARHPDPEQRRSMEEHAKRAGSSWSAGHIMISSPAESASRSLKGILNYYSYHGVMENAVLTSIDGSFDSEHFDFVLFGRPKHKPSA